jgi:signal transduction histidine kinase/uncharacterized protein HemY
MTRITTAFFLFLCLPFITLGQDQGISNERDTSEINQLLRQGQALINTNTDSGSYFARQAFLYSSQIDYEYGIALSSKMLGVQQMHKTNYVKALQYYNVAIEYFQKAGNKDELAHSYTLAGINSGMQNNSPDALNWFLRAMKIREEMKDDHDIADLNYKIGLVYGQINDYDKALAYQHKSLDYAIKHDDRKMLFGVYNNIGMLLGRKKDFEGALEALRKATDITLAGQNQKAQADIALNIGNVYREMHRYDSASSYLHTALHLYNQSGYKLGSTGTKNALADFFLMQKKYDSAMVYLDSNLVDARQMNDHFLLFDNYSMRFEILNAKGDYKAAAMLFDTLLNLKDSISNTEKAALIEQVKMGYEMDKKEAAITGLRSENSVKTTQRDILGIVVGLCAFLIVITIYGLFNIRKKNRLLEERGQKLEELNHVKDKLFSVISHDLRGPVTSITAVLELLSTMELDEDERKEIFRQLHTTTSATLETLDNLLMWGSSQLKILNSVAEAVNLKEMTERTIQLYNTGARHKSITIHNQVEETDVALFDRNQLEYILRNLVANAIKFSHQGQEVWITTETSGNRALLEVRDAGVGMNEEVRVTLFEATKKTSRGTSGESGVGLGLLLIRDFLDKNNSSIDVSSEEGKGSSFILDMPVPARN